MTCRARLSWRSPQRLSRWRTVWPEEAGIGATPARHGERGVVAAAAGVGPGAEHDGGDDRADAGLVEQVGSPGPHDRQDRRLVVGGFGLQGAGCAGRGQRSTQAVVRGLEVPAGVEPQPGGDGDEHRLVRRGRGTGTAAPRGRRRPGRGAGAGRRSRRRRRSGGRRGAPPARPVRRRLEAGRDARGRALRGRRGRRRAGRTWRRCGERPVRAVELDDQLAERRRGAGSARRRSRRCPRSPTPAARRGARRGRPARRSRPGRCATVSSSTSGAGAGGDDRGGVGVLVGVDADDDIDELCEHGHAFFSLPGTDVWFRSGSEIGRTVTGHARRLPGGQAPDQASHSGRAGAGSNERTSRRKGTKASQSMGHARCYRQQPSTLTELQR